MDFADHDTDCRVQMCSDTDMSKPIGFPLSHSTGHRQTLSQGLTETQVKRMARQMDRLIISTFTTIQIGIYTCWRYCLNAYAMIFLPEARSFSAYFSVLKSSRLPQWTSFPPPPNIFPEKYSHPKSRKKHLPLRSLDSSPW